MRESDMRNYVLTLTAATILAAGSAIAQQAPTTPMPGAAPGADAGAAAETTPIDLAENPPETLIGKTVRTSDGVEVGEIQDLTLPEGGNPGFIIVGGGLLTDTIDVPVDQAGFDETEEFVVLSLTQDELMSLGGEMPATPDAPGTPTVPPVTQPAN
jgi:Rieske Fe-S protein